MLEDTDQVITNRPPPGESPSQHWIDLQRRRAALDDEERALVERTLAEWDGVVAHAARALGIARTTLQSRLETAIAARRGAGRR